MKLATFNVNSIRSRLHIVLPYLDEERPDVLCLQETKVSDDKFPKEVLEEKGYKVFHSGDRGKSGIAVVTTIEPKYVQFGFDDGTERDRLALLKFKDFALINLYVPQGRKADHPEFQHKLEFFDRLLDFINRHFKPNDNLIVCGDLNVAPTPIDVHSPQKLKGHVCFREEVWEAFNKLIDWGLIDLFRLHHPDEPGHYTFFDYRVKDAIRRGLGWRVDHILATKPLAERCESCYIDMKPRLKEKPSDHTPLVAVFKD